MLLALCCGPFGNVEVLPPMKHVIENLACSTKRVQHTFNHLIWWCWLDNAIHLQAGTLRAVCQLS